MLDGFLGTRGDFIVDLVITVSGFLPFLMLFTFYLAAKGMYTLHRNLQILLFIVVVGLVVALEYDIQFGGLAEISKMTPFKDSVALLFVFAIHLFFAITSFGGWLWLLIKSSKRYPKHFEFNHKKWGKLIFADVVLTAITGWILYWMTFAA
ncbi:MAG: DUF420 domain-containing protein [Epsilonproteobacteria bacterium]|nr:DUF420 domain-containing protein [Campylobacterota bacterium]